MIRNNEASATRDPAAPRSVGACGRLGALLLAWASAACGPAVPTGGIELLETLPHDTTAYTQGLVFHDGMLYESTGRYGESTVRRVDPATGEVRARVELDDRYFGEGLAVVGERLVQLTWQEDLVLVWDLSTLERVDSVEVAGRGWGLCFDGDALYMTNGGSILTVRDPVSLEVRRDVQIVRGGVPLWEVNELECVGDAIYANVYQSDVIVQIDKGTGEVRREYDASALVPPALRGSHDAVLNGLAWDPDSGTFLVTGKLWPVMYRVRLTPD